MLDDAHRQLLLREMGYTLWRQRDRSALGNAPATAGALAAATALADRPSAPLPHATDPLWRALLLACAAVDASADSLGWEARTHGPAIEFDGPTLRLNLQALRADGAAKRALWKTLRGLRRQRLSGTRQ